MRLKVRPESLGRFRPGRPLISDPSASFCLQSTLGAYLVAMPNKSYLLRMRAPSGALQHVTASTVEIHGDHLIFLNSDGKLAALFLMEIVESWNVLPEK